MPRPPNGVYFSYLPVHTRFKEENVPSEDLEPGSTFVERNAGGSEVL